MSCCTPAGLVYLRRLIGRRLDIAVYPPNALEQDEPPETVYFYRPGEILVPADEIDEFEGAARRLGLRYVRLDTSSDTERRSRRWDRFAAATPGVARFLVSGRGELDEVLIALERAARGRLHPSPNHVWFGCPVWHFDPHGDPNPFPLSELEQALESAGNGSDRQEAAMVAVVDGGLPRQYGLNPVLAPVEVDAPAVSEEEGWTYHDPSKVLQSPDGHGSFVAGVVRLNAPGAEIRSYMALDPDGVIDQTDLIAQITLALEDRPQIVNLSLGGPTRNNQPPVGFGAIAARAEAKGGPIFVAAAGNLASDRVFWPAAESWVIAVGAAQIVEDRVVRAGFSDYGDWVDVWAGGVDVVSAYEANPLQPSDPSEPIRMFHGAATWSGTSFATPKVTAVVASRRSLDPGLTRVEALDYLAGLPGAAVAGLGTFVS